jgi:hypothetical protein
MCPETVKASPARGKKSIRQLASAFCCEHVAGGGIAANDGRPQLARAAEEMMVSITLPRLFEP